MEELKKNLLKWKGIIQEWFKNFKLVFTDIWSILFKFVLEIIKLYIYLFISLYLFYVILNFHESFIYFFISLVLLGVYLDKLELE
jgi:hypothetical protein